jgi:hypothetical protein
MVLNEGDRLLGGNGTTDTKLYTESEFVEKFHGPIGARIHNWTDDTLNRERRKLGFGPVPADIPWVKIPSKQTDSYTDDLESFLQKMPDEYLLMASDYSGYLARYNSEGNNIETGRPISLIMDSPQLNELLKVAELSKEAVHRAELADAIVYSMSVVDELEIQKHGIISDIISSITKQQEEIQDFIEAHRDSIPEITE